MPPTPPSEVVGGGVAMGTEAVSFVAGISVFCAHSVVGRQCLWNQQQL